LKIPKATAPFSCLFVAIPRSVLSVSSCKPPNQKPKIKNLMPLIRREFQTEATVPSDQTAPIIDFRSSDETLDHYSEKISVEGWKLDNYRKNPVVQNAHSYASLSDTIGKSLITEIRSGPSDAGSGAGVPPVFSSSGAAVPAVFGSSGAAVPAVLGSSGAGVSPVSASSGAGVPPVNSPYLFQRILFAVEENPIAKVAYGMYKAGFLNAVSVGFIPLRWQTGSKADPFKRKYLEQELVEVSGVSIPANPNALTIAVKSGIIEACDLREACDLLNELASGMEAKNLRQLTQQLTQIRSILKHT
jgi:hypothetical protein